MDKEKNTGLQLEEKELESVSGGIVDRYINKPGGQGTDPCAMKLMEDGAEVKEAAAVFPVADKGELMGK